MIYRAAAALPHEDRDLALDGLRRQLWIMALAVGATPDWATLTVAGPTEVTDVPDPTRFEWSASVAVHGVTALDALPDPDAVLPAGTSDATVPMPLVG